MCVCFLVVSWVLRRGGHLVCRASSEVPMELGGVRGGGRWGMVRVWTDMSRHRKHCVLRWWGDAQVSFSASSWTPFGIIIDVTILSKRISTGNEIWLEIQVLDCAAKVHLSWFSYSFGCFSVEMWGWLILTWWWLSQLLWFSQCLVQFFVLQLAILQIQTSSLYKKVQCWDHLLSGGICLENRNKQSFVPRIKFLCPYCKSGSRE